MDDLPSFKDEYYEDAYGHVVCLLWDDDVRITDPETYLVFDDGVVTIDDDWIIQVIPKPYFTKHFRIFKDNIKEAI